MGREPGLFERITTVNRAWNFQSRTAAPSSKEDRLPELREDVVADGRVLFL